MALETQINKIACGAGDLIGIGNAACTFDWDRIVAIEFTARSYRYTQDVTLVNMQEAQQKEEIFLIKGFDSFALVPVEPKITTNDGSGLETVDGELTYKYTGLIRYKGYNFWKALRKFNSNGGVYNIAFYDVQGNKIFCETKAGDFKGFGTQMIFAGQYKGKEGNTPAEFKFDVQLNDYKEMENQVFVNGDEIDFGINDVDGINDIVLTPSPVLTGATSMVVTATLIDNTHFANGMVVGDFIIKKNGVSIVPTTVTANPTAMTYTFTIPAATTGTYTIQTYDTTTLKNVVLIDASGILYNSNEASIIVT